MSITAPLGEARPELVVPGQPFAQTVQALGDGLARKTRERLRTHVHLDAGDHVVLAQVGRKRHAILGLLANRLVIQDHA